MEKMPSFEPKPPSYLLVRDETTGKLVDPTKHPRKLEARAFYVDNKGEPVSMTEMPKATSPSESVVIPPTEKSASDALHQSLATAGLLEIVSRVPEHDRRRVKEIRVQDLADLALAKYLETMNTSSSLWKAVKSDDPRYLNLRQEALTIAQKVATNSIQQNLYVPRALEQMRTAITQAAATIMNKKQ